MATDTSIQSDAVVTGRLALQPVRESAWLGGFGNMLNKEFGDWFSRGRWLVQALIWLAIVDGFTAFVLFVVPLIPAAEGSGGGVLASGGAIDPVVVGVTLIFALAGQAGAIGAVILAQDEIIREKQSGTAQWILSKPISRQSFVLSKLVATAIGILIFIVALPVAVGYGLVSLAYGTLIPVVPFIYGLTPLILLLLFYLTMTIMLGVLFNERAPVLGITLGLMFGAIIAVNFVPQIAYVFPVNLQTVAGTLAQGNRLTDPAMYSMLATAAWSVVFTVVALWRFAREEF
jgi:ABC-2 type transport system permease protein